MVKKKIFLAGHNGLVGSAILRQLKKNKRYAVVVKDKKYLNLLDQKKTFSFLKKKRFDSIIIAAARVGGINANNLNNGKFLYENLQIQNNLIHGSFLANIKNLIFLGSSCIYPNDFIKPIKEKDLMVSGLEKTNEGYALSKICGLKLCEYYSKKYNLNYKTLMPCNLFGPNDNYDLENSHFLPALIRKVYEAKKNNKNYIILWGNGSSLREVMYVDDLARACLFFLNKKINFSHINIASGFEKKIEQYAKIIMKYFGVNLTIKYDKNKPNGTYRKILDTKLAKKLGWKTTYSFEKALDLTVKSFINDKN